MTANPLKVVTATHLKKTPEEHAAYGNMKLLEIDRHDVRWVVRFGQVKLEWAA